MLLDLTKPSKLPVAAPAPEKPQPPEVRLVKNGVTIHPQTPAAPKQPSRLWCFFGVHKWEIHNESSWKKTYDGAIIAQGPMYILRCNVCGKMKHEKL